MRSETFSINVPGASLRVRRADVKGTPTLLLHGGPGGIDYLFKFFAKPLADDGFQAISYIQRGSPGSPSDGPFNIARFVQDVEDLRVALGLDTLALIGHSWGALLAALYAAQHPARIERLILICPIGGRDNGWREDFDEAIESRLSPAEFAEFQRFGNLAAVAPSFEQESAAMFARLNIAVMAYYAPSHRAGKPGLAHLEWRVRKTIFGELDALYGDSSWEQGLFQLKCPRTVIYGEDDPVPTHVATTWSEMLAGAPCVGLSQCGHFPWMEEPVDFFRALHFALTRSESP